MNRLFHKCRSSVLDPLLSSTRKFLPPSHFWQGPATGQMYRTEDLSNCRHVEYLEVIRRSRVNWCDLKLTSEEAEVIPQQCKEDDWTNDVYPTFLASSKRARFISYFDTIGFEDDSFFADLQFPHYQKWSQNRHPMITHPRHDRFEGHRRGRALYAKSPANLYHFIFEGVFRLAISEYCGRSISSFDVVLADDPISQFQHDLYKVIGLDHHRLESTKSRHVQFDELVYSQCTYGIDPYAVTIIRNYLKCLEPMQTEDNPGKRIYLSRGDGLVRRTINEEDLVHLLKSRGFTVVYPHLLTIAEQRYVFENSDVIISSHGAALANSIWCKDETIIIELRSSDHVRGYWRLYWNLSSACGLRHRWITCTPIKNKDDRNPQYDDFIVPLTDVNRILDEFSL